MKSSYTSVLLDFNDSLKDVNQHSLVAGFIFKTSDFGVPLKK